MTAAWIVFAIIAGGCLLVGSFASGRLYQERKDRLMVPEPIVDRYPDIRTDVRGEVELRDEIVQTAQLVQVSFPDSLIVYAPLAESAIQPVEPVPLGDVPLLAMTADRDRWKARYLHADALRARYLRLLRIARARLAFMFGDVMDASRRPSKAKLAAVVLELPRGNHLRLVPPSIANEWAA